MARCRGQACRRRYQSPTWWSTDRRLRLSTDRQRCTKQSLQHVGRGAQCLTSIPDERRSMHGGEHPWLERGKLLHVTTRPRRERYVVHQHWMILVRGHGLCPSADDVAAGDRLELPELMKEVGAEQHSIALVEQHARVPPVRQVWRWHPLETVSSGVQDVTGLQCTRRTDREILHVDHRANLATRRLSAWRCREPFVERAAFVHLEVAPANPPERSRIDDPCNGVAYIRKHSPHARVKEQRLIVLDEKMVELQVELGNVNRNPENVWGDLVDVGHR